nr:hypothetical protein MANES_15G150800 [Ipomoea batatas]GMC97348.1 hypothetical protein MANES_15G150800 [Ipomoea batatas]
MESKEQKKIGNEEGEVKAKDDEGGKPQSKWTDESSNNNKKAGKEIKLLPHQQLPQPNDFNTEALEKKL